MSFEYKSNKLILEEIAKNLEKERLDKNIKASELAKKGGFNPQTYSNFINKTSDIRMSTFLDILRGLGKLEEFEKMFQKKEVFNPIGKTKMNQKKRVRKPYLNIIKKGNGRIVFKSKAAPFSLLDSKLNGEKNE